MKKEFLNETLNAIRLCPTRQVAAKIKSKMRHVLVSITLNWQTSTSAAIRELTSTKGSQFEEKAGVIQHKLYH